MLSIPADDERAIAIAEAIRSGNVAALRQLLHAHPELPKARIVDRRGVARTLLHVVADWPGHVPSGPETVAMLVASGAEVDAAVVHPTGGGSAETALHWAASSDDVDVLDALRARGPRPTARRMAVVPRGEAGTGARVISTMARRELDAALWAG